MNIMNASKNVQPIIDQNSNITFQSLFITPTTVLIVTILVLLVYFLMRLF